MVVKHMWQAAVDPSFVETFQPCTWCGAGAVHLTCFCYVEGHGTEDALLLSVCRELIAVKSSNRLQAGRSPCENRLACALRAVN